jgi:hypothetical protein
MENWVISTKALSQGGSAQKKMESGKNAPDSVLRGSIGRC